MAGCMVARRLSSKLPKLRSPAPCPQVNSTRAFASAAKAQDDSSSAVEVGRSSRSQEKAVSTQSRGWPGSSFPSLFSPLFSASPLLRPTSLMQMMDTVDRLFSSMEPPSVSSGLKSRMPWDVIEDDKCFKLRLDMPGMTKEDVNLSVEDGDLVVRAEHKAEEGEDDWSTRSYGSYSARIKLPENVEANGIKAEMRDGVLKVTAAKVEGAKQKHEVQIE